MSHIIEVCKKGSAKLQISKKGVREAKCLGTSELSYNMSPSNDPLSRVVTVMFFCIVSVLLRHKRNHLLACVESCLFTCWQKVVPTASFELIL